MTLALVKEKLHDYIDHADAEKANAMLEFVENELPEKEYAFGEETMQMLEERWEKYVTGKSAVHTLAESKKRIEDRIKK